MVRINALTSIRVGIEDCAPNRVTAIAAAAFAKHSTSLLIYLWAQTTANAPQNVSPAATVSIAFTLKLGTCMVSRSFIM